MAAPRHGTIPSGSTLTLSRRSRTRAMAGRSLRPAATGRLSCGTCTGWPRVRSLALARPASREPTPTPSTRSAPPPAAGFSPAGPSTAPSACGTPGQRRQRLGLYWATQTSFEAPCSHLTGRDCCRAPPIRPSGCGPFRSDAWRSSCGRTPTPSSPSSRAPDSGPSCPPAETAPSHGQAWTRQVWQQTRAGRWGGAGLRRGFSSRPAQQYTDCTRPRGLTTDCGWQPRTRV
mmetsp:Transcript_36073/g.114994  ORF Transcript_36073/g.114994 Transcript_36073/m.114994 type:complete len:231 (-) Transcript_36073:1421-2113(-)